MTPPKAFITYSHKNVTQREWLETALAVMVQNGKIEIWCDAQILPGDRWEKEIEEELKESDVLLYLTSADSLASENCNNELTDILEENPKIITIPIILGDCDFLQHSLSKFEALPTENKSIKPISKWKRQSDGWQNVVDGIRRKIANISSTSISEEPDTPPLAPKAPPTSSISAERTAKKETKQDFKVALKTDSQITSTYESERYKTTEKKAIHSIQEFIEWIKENNPSDGEALYRGLSFENYEVNAPIVRRMIHRMKNPTISDMWQETARLINEARMEGYDHNPTNRGDAPSTDFELLAILQHHGAATPLMDFTSNPLVALWFACESNPQKNGKIIVVDPTDINKFCKINIRDNYISPNNIANRKNEKSTWDGLWIFTPLGFDARILAQNSEFILGKTVLDANDIFSTCIIAQENKEKIRQELEKFYGISEKILFRDLHGYARMNAYNAAKLEDEGEARTEGTPLKITPESTPEVPERTGDKVMAASAPPPPDEYEELIKKLKEAMSKHDIPHSEEYQKYSEEMFGLLSKYDPSNLQEIKILIEEMIKLSSKYEIPHSKEYKEFAKNLSEFASKYKFPYSEIINKISKVALEYNQKGINHLQKNQFDEAISNFSKAIELDPNYAPAYYNRGVVYNSKGDYYKAINDFSEAIDNKITESSPRYAEAYYNRGVAYSNTGNHDKALADYDKAIEINPNLPEAYYNRGTTYTERNDYDNALPNFTKAIELNPKFAKAYNNRGNAYHNKGKYEEAIKDLKQAIKLNPNYAIAYASLGNAYSKQKNYEEALTEYKKAIKLSPKSYRIYNARGIIYHDMEKYELAIADFNKAIKINPNNAIGYVNRGNCYDNEREYELAIADYNEAIKINPSAAAPAYNNRGITYRKKGEYGKAIADFNKAIELDPDDPGIYRNRGSTYDEKGDYDKAIADFNKAIELTPSDAIAYANRGSTYDKKGDYKKTIADYDKAIELDPNYTETYLNRGITYNNNGDYDSAIADYDKAIELKPDFAEAYGNRGISYRLKTNYDKALPDLNTAIKLKSDMAEACMAEVHFHRSIIYQHKGEHNKAIKDFDKAIELKHPPDIRDHEKIIHQNNAMEYCIRGFAHVKKKTPDNKAAKENFQTALKLAKKQGNKPLTARIALIQNIIADTPDS